MVNSLRLSRDQLAKFLPDHEAIKQFERLFGTVEAMSNDDTVEVDIASAFSAVNDLASRLSALLDVLGLEPPVVPVQAQDEPLPPPIDHAPLIARIEALEAAPPPAPYIPPTGWAVYNHGGGALALTGGVRTQLVIDGATKIETEMPPGMGSLWDTSNNAIRGRLGDGIVVKVSFTFTPSSGVANEMLAEIDVGGGVGVVEIQTFAVNKGAGVPIYISWTFTAYTLDTWVANGGKIYVTANGPGSLTVPVVLIQHTHRGQP